MGTTITWNWVLTLASYFALTASEGELGVALILFACAFLMKRSHRLRRERELLFNKTASWKLTVLWLACMNPAVFVAVYAMPTGESAILFMFLLGNLMYVTAAGALTALTSVLSDNQAA